jgi:iron complex transport system ATP-binding protein
MERMMHAVQPVIACVNISVIRSGKLLVNAASLTIAPGERIALIGPNGAGKSTLLRVLCGEIKPDRGAVTLHSKPLPQWKDRELAKVRAVLPQSSTIPFAFTSREVVELGRFPHCGGALSARDHRIVDDALALLDAQSLSSRDITTLSGGERARVHCARTLAQVWEVQSDTPQLLLLDEPTAALDLKHQGVLLRAVSEFARTRNAAVLAVLHDVNLAAEWADRMAWMKGGEIVAMGSERETMNAPQLRAVYDVQATIHARNGTGHPFAMIDLV